MRLRAGFDRIGVRILFGLNLETPRKRKQNCDGQGGDVSVCVTV